ncbi:MAG: hypothetical protein QMC80_01630 [Thermoplasmatales archaeon]|nr:hypothetical protein [Thermoplasmatales archaeon]
MNTIFDDSGGYSCSLCGCWLVEVNNEIDHIRYRNYYGKCLQHFPNISGKAFGFSVKWNRDSVKLCDTCLRTVREVVQ